MTDTALLTHALQSVRAVASPAQRRPIVHHDPMDVYRFIREYKIFNDGCSPTVREIMRACGHPSTSTVWAALYKLERQGLIVLSKICGATRSIRVVGGRWTLENEKDDRP